MSIAHNDYHKHSAYILGHADMPGFSRDDQQLLAMLVLGHQGKLAKLHLLVRSREQWLAILCLRLAVLLCRRRQDITKLPLTVSSIDASILVQVDEDGLLTQPLYDFILKAEESAWCKIGFSFELRHR
jgi:exopolyphosphatase/guanosine-5'-triphosphate,3'-diphosphate pyrophosphatase